MDLHQLNYVIEIANTKNLSKAADNLYIAQSTLSQYLTKLETELGVKLFDRLHREMVLTPAGRLYVDTCKHMLEEQQDLYRQLADLAQSKSGSFTVGITPQWGSVAFANIIGQFYETFPNIEVRVREEIAEPLLELLQEGTIDMAIIPYADDSALPNGAIILRSEELLLAIPRDHAEKYSINDSGTREDGLPVVALSELEEEPMILSQNKTTIRKIQNNCFHTAGFLPKIIAEINSHPASITMAENGIGSTFVPASCAVKSDRVVYVHTEPVAQWYVIFACRKGFKMRSGETHFVNLLKEYFSEFL